MDTQDLVSTAWAFATIGWLEALLFAALAKAAERCVGGCKFNTQDVSNTAWALGNAEQPEELLFAALGRAMEHCICMYACVINTQVLANTAWVFVMPGQLDDKLFGVVWCCQSFQMFSKQAPQFSEMSQIVGLISP